MKHLYILDCAEEYSYACYIVVADSIEEAMDYIMAIPQDEYNHFWDWDNKPIQELYRGTESEFSVFKKEWEKQHTVHTELGSYCPDYPSSWVLRLKFLVPEDEEKGVRYSAAQDG